MEQIVYGNLRVQLLNKYIVRAEYAKNGKFCDENTPYPDPRRGVRSPLPAL